MAQWGFFHDQQRCVGCRTCVISCRDWHNVKEGMSWRRVTLHENGSFPRPTVAYLSVACNHCENPPCIPACPLDVIHKRTEDGIVIVNTEECNGCLACAEACPYGAPQFGREDSPKMAMCDLCLDRISAGREPICVAACPLRALDAGPMEVLAQKHGDARSASGFQPASDTRPSIIFRARG